MFVQAKELTSNLPAGTKLNACLMKDSKLADDWKKSEERSQAGLHVIETLFSTRLSDDTYRGIVNLIKASRPNTPNDEIEKALVS